MTNTSATQTQTNIKSPEAELKRGIQRESTARVLPAWSVATASEAKEGMLAEPQADGELVSHEQCDGVAVSWARGRTDFEVSPDQGGNKVHQRCCECTIQQEGVLEGCLKTSGQLEAPLRLNSKV